MKRIFYFIQKAMRLPLHVLVFKAYSKIRTRVIDKRMKNRDLYYDPRNHETMQVIDGGFLNIKKLAYDNVSRESALYLSEMYCSHRFDLLGSGWVKNSYDSKPLGLEGIKYSQNIPIPSFDSDGQWLTNVLLPAHLESSQKIWQLIDKDYKPIDWQKDFKSGFRWEVKKWYKDQSIGHQRGADIKVPWELSRFQHLAQMSLFTRVIPDRKSILIREFRNQVLDFIATNPPRFGANWVCPMDVGIRAANLLLAYDIFLQVDEEGILDDAFKQVFVNSIYQHGHHIVNNLEYSEVVTSNHYLSDIVGLLFIAAYLPTTSESQNWLPFAVQELVEEFDKQFYNDGSNFEASTSYHRLSTELIIYGVALVLGLPEEKKNVLKNYDPTKGPKLSRLKAKAKQRYDINQKKIFPEWLIERLQKAGQFTFDITKPTQEIPQIGDNDSGRLFRLSPLGEFISNETAESRYHNLKGYCKHIESYLYKDELFWDENFLNHGAVPAALSGILENVPQVKSDNNFSLEYSIVKCLGNGSTFKSQPLKAAKIKIYGDGKAHEGLDYFDEKSFSANSSDSTPLNHNIQLMPYPDSGIYIFKSDRVYILISAGPVGQNKIGGHGHNDKLSFELNLDGKDIVVDPGSYLYTSMPDIRNTFRSTKSHSTLSVDDIEQNLFVDHSLFALEPKSKCHVLDYSSDRIQIMLEYGSIKAIRKFIIRKDTIYIKTSCNKPFKSNFNLDLFSNGYGKLISCARF